MQSTVWDDYKKVLAKDDCQYSQLVAEFWIDGRAVGKARPRFSSKGSIHTSSSYKSYKNWAIYSLKQQIKLLPAPPKPVKVECLFCNFLSSDTDNLQGTILDGLVQSGYLENDSSSYVSSCSGEFCKVRKARGADKIIGVLVRVYATTLKTIDSGNISELMARYPAIIR